MNRHGDRAGHGLSEKSLEELQSLSNILSRKIARNKDKRYELSVSIRRDEELREEVAKELMKKHSKGEK